MLKPTCALPLRLRLFADAAEMGRERVVDAGGVGHGVGDDVSRDTAGALSDICPPKAAPCDPKLAENLGVTVTGGAPPWASVEKVSLSIGIAPRFVSPFSVLGSPATSSIGQSPRRDTGSCRLGGWGPRSSEPSVPSLYMEPAACGKAALMAVLLATAGSRGAEQEVVGIWLAWPEDRPEACDRNEGNDDEPWP